MITVTGITWVGSKPILSLSGLTTDTKPLSLDGNLACVEGYKLYNGSTLMLEDGSLHKYDQENNKWDEI